MTKARAKTKASKVKAKKAENGGTAKAVEPVKSVKPSVGSKLSGVGLTVSEMSDAQFAGHLSRVLNRMKAKGVSIERMKAASIRVHARRTGALAS